MTSAASERDPLERVAEEFLARQRRGEQPTIDDYAERYPDLAEQIRQLFPTLVMMEKHWSAAAAFTPLPSGKTGEVPETLGDYRLVREVGRGGMGIVYEAVHEALGRRVALKLLPAATVSDPVRLERFEREARAAARLHHTNIVPVFAVGVHAGIHFYAMQFIEGQALDTVLKEVKRLREIQPGAQPKAPSPNGTVVASVVNGLLTGFSGQATPPLSPLSPTSLVRAGRAAGASQTLVSPAAAHPSRAMAAEAPQRYYASIARVGLQVAEALAYAHQHGVLHRDIKPANLLVDIEGRVWVTDFGLAKAEGSPELTQSGDIVGTLRYMAPERFQGRSEPQSDVYSLGITLYELLTLRPAFADDDRARLLQRVQHAAPARPRQIEPRIPRDLETILLKAAAKDTADRYATAELLAEDLRCFLADRPIRARRFSPAERLWRWCRRNRLVSGLGGLALALAVVLGISFAVISLVRGERDLAIQSQKRAEEAEQRARDAERENKIRAHLGQAVALRFGQQPGRRALALAELRAAGALRPSAALRAQLRNEAIACLAIAFDASLIRERLVPEWEALPRFRVHHDFDNRLERYARSDGRGNVSVRRWADDAEIARLALGGGKEILDAAVGEVALRLSPDGRFLLTQEKDSFKVWTLADKPPRPILRRPGRVFGPSTCVFDFHPHKPVMAFGINGFVEIFDLSQGKTLVTEPITAPVIAVAWHPQVDRLAVARPGGVKLYDLASEKWLADWQTAGKSLLLTWHPQGRRLAVAFEDGRPIQLWNVHNERRINVTSLDGCFASVMAFACRGRLLATIVNGDLKLWDWADRPESGAPGPRLVKQMPWGSVELPRFSTDDRLAGVKTRDNVLQMWQLTCADEYRTLNRDPALGWRPDYGAGAIGLEGRLLAIGSAWGSPGVGLWDLKTGACVAALPIGLVYGVAFDHSAGALFTNGVKGVYRWPIQTDEPSGRVRIGPPEKLSLPILPTGQIAVSRDGLIVASQHTALVRDEQRLLRLAGQAGGGWVALSADGRFIATSAALKAACWEARTGKLLRELPGAFEVAFSPDGKWLAIQAPTLQLWRVGSWEKALQIPGATFASTGAAVVEHFGFVFLPDGKVLAVESGAAEIRLLNPAGGQEWARLQDPHQRRSVQMFSSPDGALLGTRNVSKTLLALHVWDLRKVRRQLAAMGLDWDLPPLAPENPAWAKGPLQIDLDLGPSFPVTAEFRRILDYLRP